MPVFSFLAGFFDRKSQDTGSSDPPGTPTDPVAAACSRVKELEIQLKGAKKIRDDAQKNAYEHLHGKKRSTAREAFDKSNGQLLATVAELQNQLGDARAHLRKCQSDDRKARLARAADTRADARAAARAARDKVLQGVNLLETVKPGHPAFVTTDQLNELDAAREELDAEREKLEAKLEKLKKEAVEFELLEDLNGNVSDERDFQPLPNDSDLLHSLALDDTRVIPYFSVRRPESLQTGGCSICPGTNPFGGAVSSP